MKTIVVDGLEWQISDNYDPAIAERNIRANNERKKRIMTETGASTWQEASRLYAKRRGLGVEFQPCEDQPPAQPSQFEAFIRGDPVDQIDPDYLLAPAGWFKDGPYEEVHDGYVHIKELDEEIAAIEDDASP